MQISVVVTTKNEEKNLENCLKSIKNQNFSGEIEIIVVDNNSQDKTKEIAQRYTNLVYNFGPERSSQRNFGVAKSTADYFIFLDADMVLSENIIAECVKKIKNNPKTVGLYIPEIILGNSFFNKIRNFERSFYNGTVIDAPRFIKKSVFDETGGFDEQLYAGEDWDLTRRIEKTGLIKIIKDPIYHNEADINLKKYLEKKIYYAGNIDKYISKWEEKDEIIKKQLGFFYRFLVVFFEKGKWKKVLRHPILMVGIYWIKLLVGMVYIFKSRNDKGK